MGSRATPPTKGAEPARAGSGSVYPVTARPCPAEDARAGLSGCRRAWHPRTAGREPRIGATAWHGWSSSARARPQEEGAGRAPGPGSLGTLADARSLSSSSSRSGALGTDPAAMRLPLPGVGHEKARGRRARGPASLRLWQRRGQGRCESARHAEACDPWPERASNVDHRVTPPWSLLTHHRIVRCPTRRRQGRPPGAPQATRRQPPAGWFART
jgi:hypothetical protein